MGEKPLSQIRHSFHSKNVSLTINGKIYVGGIGAGGQFFPDVLVFDTGFRAVTARGKLFTRWSELKAEHQTNLKKTDC